MKKYRSRENECKYPTVKKIIKQVNTDKLCLAIRNFTARPSERDHQGRQERDQNTEASSGISRKHKESTTHTSRHTHRATRLHFLFG